MKAAEIETNREHESFFTTTYHSLINWARKSSLWPYPFGTACCAIEFMATVSSHYDIARFGSEVVRFSPKQSDVLMVLGTINDKMGPVRSKSTIKWRSQSGSFPWARARRAADFTGPIM